MSITIGILALQGCYQPHEKTLTRMGVTSRQVREVADLDGIDGLILPGGESTTMLKTARAGFWDAVKSFSSGHPIFGVCAGCILLADKVTHPDQTSLGLLDIEVARNAWGAQNESFTALLDLEDKSDRVLTGIFIRAPRIVAWGDDVEILARFGHEPVMVRSGRILATTFHPELATDDSVHRDFLDLI